MDDILTQLKRAAGEYDLMEFERQFNEQANQKQGWETTNTCHNVDRAQNVNTELTEQDSRLCAVRSHLYKVQTQAKVICGCHWSRLITLGKTNEPCLLIWVHVVKIR